MARCPYCHGDNGRKLSQIVLDGTYTGDSSGVGITLDGKIAIGIGGTQGRTELAEQAAFRSSIDDETPWGRTGYVLGIIAGVVIGLATDDFLLGAGWAVGIITTGWLLGWLTGQTRARDRAKQEERATWERTWMCLDCGERWVH